MDSTKSQSRLVAIDGIRGIAIILVVLTHVSSELIQKNLPAFVSRVLFSSGVTGVSLLFILSGFFMALMYPSPHDRLAFIQKRYTRIFPLFLTMCALTVLVRIEAYSWAREILVFFALSFAAHVTWIYVAKRWFSTKLKRLIFLLFLGVQMVVGAVYYLWLMRQPVQVFMEVWSLRSRELMTGLINATLTLPLGNYIPMIDGVYWSLAAEVLFYILYVIVCVPLIGRLRHKNRIQKCLVLALCFPFFGALQIFSDRFLNLSLLRPLYGIYFAMGISLGYLYRQHPEWFRRSGVSQRGWRAWLPVIFFFFCIATKDQSFQYVPDWFDPWLHMLWSIPLTIAVALALDTSSRLSTILQSRVLVFYGMISYSVYLCHSLTLHLVEMVIPLDTVAANVVYILLTLIGSTLAAMWLYELLEKPYFMRSESKQADTFVGASSLFRRPQTILMTVAVLLVVMVLGTYQSKYQFFSNSVSVPLTPTQVADRWEFTAPTDTLGLVTLRFSHERRDAHPGPSQRIEFVISALDSTGWSARNTYALEEIGDDTAVPFGFPLQLNTRGKRYAVSVSTLIPESSEYIVVDRGSFILIDPVDKRTLFSKPQRLIGFIVEKIKIACSDREAQFVLASTIPALAIVWYFTSTRTRKA